MKNLNKIENLQEAKDFLETQKIRLVITELDGYYICRLFKATPKAKYLSEKQIEGYKFKTEDRRDEYVLEYCNNKLKSIKDKEIYKAEQKELKAKQKALVEVGDVFNYSWGWEQTNQNFYQVISKPTPSTIIIKEISYDSIETTSWASEYVKPVKDSFINDREEKVTLSGDSFKRSCGYANKVEDLETRKFYRSWYA